jgi:hypothetical protein
LSARPLQEKLFALTVWIPLIFKKDFSALSG